MNIIKRLRNLWELSAYRPHTDLSHMDAVSNLRKDFPTIQKKAATIIFDKPNYFDDSTSEWAPPDRTPEV